MAKITIEPKFKKDDYIINRSANDMAIVDSITPKGYYHFKAYYGGMFKEFRDVKNKMNDLQINYQKFWEPCTNEEKKQLDKLIKEKGGN